LETKRKKPKNSFVDHTPPGAAPACALGDTAARTVWRLHGGNKDGGRNRYGCKNKDGGRNRYGCKNKGEGRNRYRYNNKDGGRNEDGVIRILAGTS
jgi:hypothetical protein